jgi:hypothetical protein
MINFDDEMEKLQRWYENSDDGKLSSDISRCLCFAYLVKTSIAGIISVPLLYIFSKCLFAESVSEEWRAREGAKAVTVVSDWSERWDDKISNNVALVDQAQADLVAMLLPVLNGEK